jgi:hypothetical protein
METDLPVFIQMAAIPVNQKEIKFPPKQTRMSRLGRAKPATIAE